MSSQRVLGLILLVVGVGLFLFGLNATESISEEVSEGLTGKFSDETTWYLLGGLALALVGGTMALFRGGRLHRG